MAYFTRSGKDVQDSIGLSTAGVFVSLIDLKIMTGVNSIGTGGPRAASVFSGYNSGAISF